MSKKPKPPTKNPAIREIERELNEVVARVRAGIAEHGWFAISTSMGIPEEPAYTYTIGFQASFSAPDLIVFGLDPETAQHYLREAANQARTPGGAIRNGHLPQFFNGFDGWAIPVDCAGFDARFRVSSLLYPGQEEGAQLVFPDQMGWFPWDRACAYRGRIPLLGRAPVKS